MNNSIKGRTKKDVRFKEYAFRTDEDGNKIPLKLNKETGEYEEKNPPFFQFYKQNTPLIRKLIKTNPLAAQIFMFFVENMDGTNAIIISYQAMEEIFEVSRRTINRAIKELKDNKYIDIQKSGNMNIYCINAALVWQQSRKKIKFAKFKATVYISESEQTVKIFHSEIKTKGE